MIRRRTKYGAVPTVVDGVRYASKLEAKRAKELALLQKAGEISKLEAHPLVVLVKGPTRGESITYRPDFTYVEAGMRIYEEVKGRVTEGWRLKKKLWRLHGRALLIVRTPNGRGGWLTAWVEPIRKATALGRALRKGDA